MDILDELDKQWREGKRPELAEILEQLKRSGEFELCVEICASDLEWHWRARHAASMQHNQELELAYENSAAIPRATDYQVLLGSLLHNLEHNQRLLESEFLARSRWGDQPNVDEFLQQNYSTDLFGTSYLLPNNEVFRDYLAEQLEHLAQFTVRVSRKRGLAADLGTRVDFQQASSQSLAECVLTKRLPALFEIGRQDKHDPTPPAWISQENRLIVAARDDRQLSRHQIRIRRTGIHEVELTNISRNVSLPLASDRLQPGDRTLLSTPISIEVSDLQIAIRTER